MLCKLVYKRCLSDGIMDYTIMCPEMAEKAKPGQFLHILCGGESYLRRPISICDVSDKRCIRFVFRIKGEGTKALAAYNEGDMLDVLGPLGNGFDISEDRSGAVLLIGGGIGVFPLLYLAKSLSGTATALLGFRGSDEVVMTDEFAKVCKDVFLATDDGSCGYHGLVTDIMNKIIESNKVSAIYSCGPAPMMKAVSNAADAAGIPVQVSLEERMGCGVGACMTCTCTVAGMKRRVCKDGPVFDGTEVEWNG